MMVKNFVKIFLAFVLATGIWGCFEEVAVPIEGDFTYKTTELVAPATVSITNGVTGAEAYLWSFEGGSPAQSNLKNPVVTYNKTGTFKIKLVASNLDGEQKVVEKTVTIGDNLAASLKYTIKGNTYAPVEVQFESTVKGTSTQQWTFEGGIPAQSSEKNPVVQYNIGGPRKVSLKVTNGFRTIQKDTVINLEPDLTAKFSLVKKAVLFENEVPITFDLKNDSQGAITYKWTMDGATPAASIDKEPIVNYTEPGVYKIILETSNGKVTKTSSTEIELQADKGYRLFENIKFGIASAQDSLGSYFSTSLGKVFRGKDIISAADGSAIDIVFFGLDQKLSFSQFISPQKVAEKGFLPIVSATNTKFLNSHNLAFAANFETIDQAFLTGLPISKSVEITKFIPLALPQVVLFENSKGKKGAILVKEFVAKGDLSYIAADIKVLK
jgi:PKD repeat protein